MTAISSIVSTVGIAPDHGLPPAALARHADVERRRELARALHTPIPRASSITERLEAMRQEIARYRVQAIALHAKLLELEAAGNDNVADLRRQLIESSVRIENVARTLVDTPAPRFPRGTEELDPAAVRGDVEAPEQLDTAAVDDWRDTPTLRPTGDERPDDWQEDWPEEPTLRRR